MREIQVTQDILVSHVSAAPREQAQVKVTSLISKDSFPRRNRTGTRTLNTGIIDEDDLVDEFRRRSIENAPYGSVERTLGLVVKGDDDGRGG